MMIPSENYASKDVLKAVGSVLSNKYAEGYPRRRYYQGNEFVDQIEQRTIDLAKEVFGVPHANVQPYSGSPANSAVYFALMEPGDCLMGLSLASGGHLTHGHPNVTFSGKYFKSIQYEINCRGAVSAPKGGGTPPLQNEWFNYDEILKLAKKHRPKVIVCGTTAFPRILDFKKFAEIADAVGAYLLADISHIVGLVLAGVHPSPVPYAHIVMSTTHKSLRGPRGAMLLVTEKGMKKDPDLASKIDKAVFPGLQGGPHMNQIAALAIALEETKTKKFVECGKQIVKNAKILEEVFCKNKIEMVTGGTDNHLLLLDLPASGYSPGVGMFAAEALEAAGIVANKNSIPNEPFSAFYPSGIRLGTPALTTRGFREKEMEKVGAWICEVLNSVKKFEMPKEKEKRVEYIKKFRSEIGADRHGSPLRQSYSEASLSLHKIKAEVRSLCKKFPVYR